VAAIRCPGSARRRLLNGQRHPSGAGCGGRNRVPAFPPTPGALILWLSTSRGSAHLVELVTALLERTPLTQCLLNRSGSGLPTTMARYMMTQHEAWPPSAHRDGNPTANCPPNRTKRWSGAREPGHFWLRRTCGPCQPCCPGLDPRRFLRGVIGLMYLDPYGDLAQCQTESLTDLSLRECTPTTAVRCRSRGF